MIKNYNQHAANERNYLSWIRTALSLLAFGIILEKSDTWFQTSKIELLPFVDDIIGLIFIGLGALLLISSTYRLKKVGKLIEQSDEINWDNNNHSFYFGTILSCVSVLIFVLFIILKFTR